MDKDIHPLKILENTKHELQGLLDSINDVIENNKNNNSLVADEIAFEETEIWINHFNRIIQHLDKLVEQLEKFKNAEDK